MVRTLAAAFAALLVPALIDTLPPALAQAPDPTSLSTVPPPMRFEWVREGPLEQCGSRCREWISAAGAIVDTTVRDFEAFARQRDVRGAVIVLDSPGGNVAQGLALGREFRRLGVTTSVGRTVIVDVGEGGQRAALSPYAACNSMCVFVLLGGVRRHIPEEARIYVHQIWPAGKRHDAMAATYSATNIATIQRVNGEISRYIVDMGAHIELFEIASRIPPWEEMRLLSRQELRRMGVHNTDDPFALASTSPPSPTWSASLGSAPVAVRNGEAAANALGWVFVERGGEAALVRWHPITLEGQEIGRFELAFACGDHPGLYRVTYLEKRMVANPAAGGFDRLEAVGISVRQNNLPQRSMLVVDESVPDDGKTEMSSRARGTVPASFLEMIATAPSGETVALSSQQGLIVTTTTVDKRHTVIRVGQAGLAEGLRRLAKSCASARPD